MQQIEYIKYKEPIIQGKWLDIDFDALDHMPQRHVLDLLSQRNIPVVAKTNEGFIVNSDDMVEKYRCMGKRVQLFQQIRNQSTVLLQSFGNVRFSIS